jgi:prepilin-type processing-associated H-X9-DG protein
MAAVVKGYICPADGRWDKPRDTHGVAAGFTSYIGILSVVPPGRTTGLEGMFGAGQNRFSSVTDGLSQTIMVGERPPPDGLQAGWWYPGFLGSMENPGPNNRLIVGPVLLGSDDQCNMITPGIALGPGRTDNPCDRYHFWSLHSGGANFLFGDGSVRFLAYSANKTVFDLASRSGGEVVDLP